MVCVWRLEDAFIEAGTSLLMFGIKLRLSGLVGNTDPQAISLAPYLMV